MAMTPDRRASRMPHVVVIGNHKGGSGKSTLAIHLIVALLRAGKRIASFDLDMNQQTLTQYIDNRREWALTHGVALAMPDHCSIAEDIGEEIEPDDAAKAGFFRHLEVIQRKHNHDFIVIDTPGGVQHLSIVAHGMADTLITPINDSLLDLNVLVAIGCKEKEPQPSHYAKAVARALTARREVCGRATDWVVVRNRMDTLSSRNQRQVEDVLTIIAPRLGFRTLPGLSDRLVFREFFAAGLTAFDFSDEPKLAHEPNPSGLLARSEVSNLIERIGLLQADFVIERAFGAALAEVELAMAECEAEQWDVVERQTKVTENI
jgi:chromosome partitioning protein